MIKIDLKPIIRKKFFKLYTTFFGLYDDDGYNLFKTGFEEGVLWALNELNCKGKATIKDGTVCSDKKLEAQ